MIANLVQGSQKVRSSLRWQWCGYALSGIFLYIGGFFILREAWGSEHARRWLVLALLAFGIILWNLWSNLGENRRLGEEVLLSGLGAGNWASLTRGALIAALYGFLFSPLPVGDLAWLPGVITTLAVLIDGVDGLLARLTDRVTRLGEKLDMFLDGLGILIATALLVQYGKVPLWYLLIGLARYLFLAGMWLRERIGKVNFPMPDSIRRRWLAAMQMGFVSVVLFPIFSPPATRVVALVFGLPMLIGFLWDWLYVCGMLHPEVTRRYPELKNISLLWLPIGLRIGVVVCSLPALFNSTAQVGFVISGWVILILVMVGAAGRVAAIAGLVSLGLQQAQAALLPIELLLGILFALLLLLGSGAFSLWTPENGLIYRRVGERPNLLNSQGRSKIKN